MSVINRLFEYLHHHRLSPYQFERNCLIANGYLKKQQKGKGTIGSEILEKISARYLDLSLSWLITGKGNMLTEGNYNGPIPTGVWSEDKSEYITLTVQLLKDKIRVLEQALADKEKIIRLLEQGQKAG